MISAIPSISSEFLTPLDWEKLEEMKKICHDVGIPLTDQVILVNVTTQKLHVLALQTLILCYCISTAKNGVGQKEGTGQTPLGLHMIREKIGDGAEPFEIFRSRISTKGIAEVNGADKLIVGRILWLDGMQSGLNKGIDAEGSVVDSHDRYIYIHGTNDIANIGKPVSSGCVRMKPNDVIELFATVPTKTLVYIYES